MSTRTKPRQARSDRNKMERPVVELAAPVSGGGGTDDHALDLLDKVKLRSFDAMPAVLQPFESSLLRWNVDAPTGVRIKLDGAIVPNIGSKSVQPAATQTFRLSAHVASASQFLGSVTVSTNLSHCTSRSIVVDQLLADALSKGVQDDPDVYFRIIAKNGPGGTIQYVQSQPEVITTSGRFRFKLKLAGKVNNFPDPDIDVDARFGLSIVPSSNPVTAVFPKFELAPANVEVDVNVSFPWWAYLIPGAPIGLPIAASMAEDRAKASFSRAIGRFVKEGIETLFDVFAPAGMQKHAVRIFNGDSGGTVEVDFCPVPQPVVVQ